MKEYYQIPLNFKELFKKKDHAYCSFENSIRQHSQLLITTTWGECKLDAEYGSFFWDNDFDILSTNAKRKEMITHSIQYAVQQYEKRIHKVRVDVEIMQAEVRNEQEGVHLKRKVSIQINGVMHKNNQPIRYNASFFVGPFAKE